MSEIIDISLPVSSNLTTWPDSSGFQILKTKSLENNDGVNESKIICNIHTGTHIDAPLHYIKNGASIEKLNLEILLGPVYVLDLTNTTCITLDVLQHASIPEDTKRILFKTRNSNLWKSYCHEFKKDYVALSSDAARWLVERNISLVGIDYLSIQGYYDKSNTHTILLSAGVVILEGLNLSHVRQGQYSLICLPMNIVGAEGAPARAVLIKE